jgi:hypothetical protein
VRVAARVIAGGFTACRLVTAEIIILTLCTATAKVASDILARSKAARYQDSGPYPDAERFNAIGILKGDGSVPTLMLNGHMGMAYTGNEKRLPYKS